MFIVNHDWGKIFIWFSHGPNSFRDNNSICKKLDMAIEEFDKLVEKHNGKIEFDYTYSNRDYYEHYFSNLEDAHNCLKELEPLIVMAKLIK